MLLIFELKIKIFGSAATAEGTRELCALEQDAAESPNSIAQV